MASFARRVAPAAALGGLAIVIVGVADPALAGHTSSPATTDAQSTAGPAAAPAATTDATGTTTDTASADGACTGDQVAGDEVMTRWGPVQVTATVSGGTVCAVQAVEWPSQDGRSQQINAYAIPQLDAWASASPTQFDYVSGATYTSQAYHQSLQSILDTL